MYDTPMNIASRGNCIFESWGQLYVYTNGIEIANDKIIKQNYGRERNRKRINKFELGSYHWIEIRYFNVYALCCYHTTVKIIDNKSQLTNIWKQTLGKK